MSGSIKKECVPSSKSGGQGGGCEGGWGRRREEEEEPEGEGRVMQVLSHLGSWGFSIILTRASALA